MDEIEKALRQDISTAIDAIVDWKVSRERERCEADVLAIVEKYERKYQEMLNEAGEVPAAEFRRRSLVAIECAAAVRSSTSRAPATGPSRRTWPSLWRAEYSGHHSRPVPDT